MPFPGALELCTLLFVGLKVAGVIDWSWWWVLAPLWIPTVIGLVVLALFVSVRAWLGR